jgi:alpha-L-rhamnosidase
MPRFTNYLLIASISLAVGCAGSSIKVHDLLCENLADPLGIDTFTPHLSWKVSADQNGTQQYACQVLAASETGLLNESKADLWNSGRVASDVSVMLPYAGKPLASRSAVYWKVRVWDEKGRVSRWSDVAMFSVGLDETDWKGGYIGLSREAGNPQSPLLRKQFEVADTDAKAFLYVNSLGYHEIYVNGERVGEDVLSPAVSQLNKRSLFVTYNIAPYLQKGRNDLIVWLGQGWYRPGLPGVVYDGPLAKIQLEEQRNGQWNTVAVSDASWQAAESGYYSIGSWKPHQFGGERVDGAKVPVDLTTATLDQLKWSPVAEIDVPPHAVSAQMTESNRIYETITATDIQPVGDSAWLVDMGKTLAGYAEIHFPELKAGQEINIMYSDHFNSKGELANMGQRDCYIALGKGNDVFRNKFNYHGYRYLKISGLVAPPERGNIKAHLIHTGYRQASAFECSDSDMNAIHDMIQYTFRCLTLGGYMVDCPQIERLGYGGDGNASTQTAQTMYDMSPLYANWMQAWADCIRPDGGLPHTAPNPYKAGGGPYWCGFIITASWNTYVNYGDPRLIEKYYPVMQQWLGYVAKYSVDGLLKRWPDTDYRNWYLGDWACPKGIDQTAEASVDLVNNCFVSECYRVMEKIARALSKTADAEKYALQRKDLQQLIQQHFFDQTLYKYGTGTQIDLAYPMLAKVTPDSLLEKVTGRLYYETEQNQHGHLASGLVGVPVLTEWAVKNRAVDWVYSMLKKRDYPGYLYMIDNGATSTWEHWNGDRSRIHNCYNGIGSWFYQAVGGIIPDEEHPGYREVFISPQIPKGITWAKTAKETPYGTLSVDWALDGNILNMNMTVPVGCKAKVLLPASVMLYDLDGVSNERKNDPVVITGGKYVLSYQINR